MYGRTTRNVKESSFCGRKIIYSETWFYTKKVKSIGSGIIDSTLTIVFLFLITLKVNSLKNKKNKSEMNDKENKNGRE